MDKPLQGQTVLVTGATGGIGAAIVARIAAEGARPIIHYEKDDAAATAMLAGIGGVGLAVQADLSLSESAFTLWRQAVAFAGRIHSVVNCAGTRTDTSIESTSKDWKAAWQREFQVNCFAAADICKEAISHFKTEGGGRIINIASRSGQRGATADAIPYGASKAALINITKSIARSFGRDGVTAVAIAPGMVRTEMAEAFVGRYGTSAALGDIPIGDMAEPAEIAELVAFVLRYSQDSLNGTTLDVNGGSYVR